MASDGKGVCMGGRGRGGSIAKKPTTLHNTCLRDSVRNWFDHLLQPGTNKERFQGFGGVVVTGNMPVL